MDFLYLAEQIFVILKIKNDGKLVIVESEDCVIDLHFKRDFKKCKGVVLLRGEK